MRGTGPELEALSSARNGERAGSLPRRHEYRSTNAEGLERSRNARWKHGYYSAEDKAARQQARMIRWALRQLMDSL